MKPNPFAFTLFAFCATANAQPTFDGVLVIEGGDRAEECVEEYITTAPITGYDVPNRNGRPIRTVLEGRRIEGNDRSEAWSVIRRPGRIRANGPINLEASSYGSTSRINRSDEALDYVTLRLQRGDEIEFLGGAGEGFVWYRRNGTIYHGDGVWIGPQGTFTDVSALDSELWLRLVARDGKPAAWINITHRTQGIGCAGD